MVAHGLLRKSRGRGGVRSESVCLVGVTWAYGSRKQTILYPLHGSGAVGR